MKVENLAWGLNEIAEPARYVTPGGEVRLKLEGSTSDFVQIDASTITLVVSR